jgi:NADH-quinone oxidoreductase subunit K
MSLAGPYVLAALLVGIGLFGALARRNAVLMLIGVELVLGGALVLLVSTAAAAGDQWSGGTVLSLFVITIAAAEVALALAVILAAFRSGGGIDLEVGEE